MSVWATALMEYRWTQFQPEVIEKIASAFTPYGSYEWLNDPDKNSEYYFETPEAELAANGHLHFHVREGEFFINLTKNVVSIKNNRRWSYFLTDETERSIFLALVASAMKNTGAKEALVMPEGTLVEDHCIWKGGTFESAKRFALDHKEYGPPDLDAKKIYTIEEISRFPTHRVHYFLIS